MKLHDVVEHIMSTMIIEVSQKLQHWSCEFTTSSATDASWLPILDCGTTFLLDHGSQTCI